MTERKEKTEYEQEQRPYEAPEVRTDEVFESLALTCTKAIDRCGVVVGDGVVQS